MALQDLTPQLRTRLSRMERAVGWFVFLATALLVFGFGYYIYHTAEQKGWFKIKAPFFVFVKSSAGLNVGDNVYMMGFAVGHITRVEPLPPYNPHNVRVDFNVVDPYFRRIWLGGSYVKINNAGFLNQRQLEVTRGTNGPAIVVTQPGEWKTIPELEQLVATETNHWQLYQNIYDADSNLVFGAYTMLDESNLQVMAAMDLPTNSVFAYDNTVNRNHIVAAWDNRVHRYVNFSPTRDSAWLRAVETPPVSDQLQAMVAEVQTAVPNILALTNRIAEVLDNAANATSNLEVALVETRPAVKNLAGITTNLAQITAQLREPGGPVVWALGTNGNAQLQGSLTNVNALLANADTNLTAMLINLANVTSNLNAQVQSNSNMLSGISKTVMDADDFVQGLKRFWLFRSTFRKENEAGRTNAPPVQPLLPPRMR